MLEKINSVIDNLIRPLLAQHNGDIEVVDVKDDVVVVKFLGKCNGCISAQSTIEDVVENILKKEIPIINEVKLLNKTNEDLLNIAKKFLKNKKENNNNIDINEIIR